MRTRSINSGLCVAFALGALELVPLSPAHAQLGDIMLEDQPREQGPSPQAPPAADGGDSGEPSMTVAPSEEQTAEDAEAKKEFEHGRKAYDEGRYRDAWTHFHTSYQLSNRAALLYNIGQTADRMGKDADALRAFRLYLKRNPEAANREQVENRIRALEGRVELTEEEAQSDEPPVPPHVGQPTRQGLYLRGGLGFGFLNDHYGSGANLTGFSLNGEILVGWGVWKGLVLGGGIWFDWGAGVTSSAVVATRVGGGWARLTSFGAFADWYVMPQDSGLHFQLGLAVGNMSADNLGATSPKGFTLLAGGGYEWPIGESLAVGLMGRFTFATLEATKVGHRVIALSVLGSITWF